jgi:hypothetical protein
MLTIGKNTTHELVYMSSMKQGESQETSAMNMQTYNLAMRAQSGLQPSI